jgi:hypothetical protein
MPRKPHAVTGHDALLVRALARTAIHYAPSPEAFCATLARLYLEERGTPELMPGNSPPRHAHSRTK